jgi:hypothetical protein
MDRVKFNQLADDIANAYGTDRSRLFERSKKQIDTQPRHLLWYVCSKRGIPNVFIESFTNENGLEVNHSTISRGISRAVTIIKRNEQARKLSETLIKSK